MITALLPSRLRTSLRALEANARTLRLFLGARRQPLFQSEFAPLPEPVRAPRESAREPAPEPLARSAAARHRVRYLASGAELEVAEDQTLLAAGLAAGLTLRSACRRGLCGTCKSRLVSGAVEMAQPNALSDEERARGYCLPCISRPRGEIVLDA